MNQFKKKWVNNKKLVKGPFEKNKRIHVEIKRNYRDIKNFLEKNLTNLSLGKHLDKKITKNYEIIELEKLLNENLRIFWTDYLDEKDPWER